MPTNQTIQTYLKATVYKGISKGTLILNPDDSSFVYPDETTQFVYGMMSIAETNLFILYPGLSLSPIPRRSGAFIYSINNP